MKAKFTLIAGTLLAVCISLPLLAQSDPDRGRVGPVGKEKAINPFIQIEIRNFQDEVLGRIDDLSLDLVNGRIVGVLVVTDSSLGLGDKVVSVPPLAFFPDAVNEVYRLNMSPEDFKAAPAVDMTDWVSSGHSNRVAAFYNYFGQEPQGTAAGTGLVTPKCR